MVDYLGSIWEWVECSECGEEWEVQFYEDETGWLIAIDEYDLKCVVCGGWADE